MTAQDGRVAQIIGAVADFQFDGESLTLLTAFEAQDFEETLVLDVAKHSSKKCGIIPKLVHTDWPEAHVTLDTDPSPRPSASPH